MSADCTCEAMGEFAPECKLLCKELRAAGRKGWGAVKLKIRKHDGVKVRSVKMPEEATGSYKPWERPEEDGPTPDKTKLSGATPAHGAGGATPAHGHRKSLTIFTWQESALALGERLASERPAEYHSFTPKQWLEWALNVTVGYKNCYKEWHYHADAINRLAKTIGLLGETSDAVIDRAIAMVSYLNSGDEISGKSLMPDGPTVDEIIAELKRELNYARTENKRLNSLESATHRSLGDALEALAHYKSLPANPPAVSSGEQDKAVLLAALSGLLSELDRDPTSLDSLYATNFARGALKSCA